MPTPSNATTRRDFLVQKSDWRQRRFVATPVPAQLAPGQVLFRVDRFALTANNISYALAGDLIGYWSFFPAAEGWGRIPAMGFGDVIASAHADVRRGERVFGFFPMSTHLLIDADHATPTHFSDAAPHRRESAPAYRQYTRTAADPLYDAAREDQVLLLRGLFLTSFLIDDFIADNDCFGARSYVIASASSKTAIALAFLLSKESRGEVVGLTSPANTSFVERLGCYDRVVPYGEIESLGADVPIVFVDMAGNGDVVRTVHRHFGDNVKHSCSVGATHWDRGGSPQELPGAPPTFFFAPTQIQKRTQEWGPARFQERLGGAWRGFLTSTDDWLEVARSRGEKAVERAYEDVLEGRARPNQGHVLSLWEDA